MSPKNYLRMQAGQRFEKVQRRASMSRYFRKFARQPLTLLPFAPVYEHLPRRNGVDRGVQEIPLSQIVGSMSRASEYDRSFRPLTRDQRERWVNMWVLHAQNGWDPIMVRQVGNLYFVEDGHHRTSVARDAGLTVIEARVIEYPVACKFHVNESIETVIQCLQRRKKRDLMHPVPNLCYDYSTW